MQRIRGTCVAVDGHGVLIRGPSGSGKSDLALRLIDDGARLVADDYTAVTINDGGLTASAPEPIRGLIEVRGLGILRFAAHAPVRVVVVVELGSSASVERLPAPAATDIAGVSLPLVRLAAFEASAAAKVRLAVRIATGGIMPVR